MGVSAAIAVAVGAGVHQSEQAKTAQKQAKREMKTQQIKADRQEAAEKDRQLVSEEQMRQRSARAKQRAMSGGQFGRQGTVLGGASNTGNQAQSGAGKTLLGV